MKLRALICLVLAIIVISDVTVVASINAANVTNTKTTNATIVDITNIGVKTAAFEYVVSITMYGHARCFAPSRPLRSLVGYININGHLIQVNRSLAASWWTETPAWNQFSFRVNRGIHTIYLGYTHGYARRWQPPCCDDPAGHFIYRKTRVISDPHRRPSFRIYKHNELVASGSGLGTHILNLPPPPRIINLSHALNFTLAGAMALPTMSIGVVDDIMLIVGKYINCGLAKFAIRAALLKFAAKGVAITVAIAGISYLLAEFADDIYHAIFATVPEVHPGDTHFHKNDLPQVMGIIHSYFPTEPHITKAIEQAIRLHIDIHGMISVAQVMTIVRHKQKNIIIDVYKETPEILPDNIPVHRDQVPEIMDMVDEYFPIEIPIRNIIEEEIHREIDRDVGHEIPIKDVIEIIEEKQNIVIPETPPAFPPYVNEINLPDVIDLIDEYFHPELPIRDIIEDEIYEEIQRDYYNEIPLEEVIDIIEREQNIFVPEIPVETPEQHRDYINEIINRIEHEDIFIPIPATPYIFPGIPATPIIPRTPKRPDEKIHTFPFYSIFVDPLAAVIGITLAHLFAAMMIIGAIISIGAAWGSLGAILAGFIGTITTSYFGLTSWLIPLYLVVIFIIYVNIRIRKGGD